MLNGYSGIFLSYSTVRSAHLYSVPSPRSLSAFSFAYVRTDWMSTHTLPSRHRRAVLRMIIRSFFSFLASNWLSLRSLHSSFVWVFVIVDVVVVFSTQFFSVHALLSTQSSTVAKRYYTEHYHQRNVLLFKQYGRVCCIGPSTVSVYAYALLFLDDDYTQNVRRFWSSIGWRYLVQTRWDMSNQHCL